MTEDLTRLKKQNAPDSFSVWLRKQGAAASTAGADNAARAFAANTLTHGTGAERLFDKGLEESGYARYLSDQAKKSFEEQKKALATENAARKEKDLSGYARYLTSHEESQKSLTRRVTESIGKGKSFDLENAYRVALASGLTEKNARIAAEVGIEAAKKRMTSHIIEAIIDKKLSQRRTVEYAKRLGFSDAEAESFGAYAEQINGVYIPSKIPENLFD